MHPNAASSNDPTPIERRFTVHEAASVLGITPEAVRSRIQRGTLTKDKGDDGTVYVRLNDDQSRPNGDERSDSSSSIGVETSDETSEQSRLVEHMASEIEHLREVLALRDEEIRRRDHLLAAALERIPALEAPPDTPSGPRESPQTASEEPSGTQSPQDEEPEAERPKGFWRRLFGG